jgi:hypothetical protein
MQRAAEGYFLADLRDLASQAKVCQKTGMDNHAEDPEFVNYLQAAGVDSVAKVPLS